MPSTLGEDGDPLDVLLLMDEPTFPGCVVEARLIGAIEAWHTEKGRTVRNDRLIAVATEARTFRSVRSLRDVDGDLLDELEHFFVTSGERAGERVRTRLLRTARAAQGLVSRGTARYDGQRTEPGVSPARGRPRSRRANSRPRA